jgi:hypothetical protein
MRMVKMSRCYEQLAVTRTSLIENDVIVDNDGNLHITTSDDEIDTLDAYDLWCIRHGRVTYDMYEDHGIGDEWEVVW